MTDTSTKIPQDTRKWAKDCTILMLKNLQVAGLKKSGLKRILRTSPSTLYAWAGETVPTLPSKKHFAQLVSLTTADPVFLPLVVMAVHLRNILDQNNATIYGYMVFQGTITQNGGLTDYGAQILSSPKDDSTLSLMYKANLNLPIMQEGIRNLVGNSVLNYAHEVMLYRYKDYTDQEAARIPSRILAHLNTNYTAVWEEIHIQLKPLLDEFLTNKKGK